MSGIYQRDFRRPYTEEEAKLYQEVCDRENTGNRIGRINHYPDYPEAVRHYISLFPNHHIDPWDWTSRDDFDEIVNGYERLIHDPKCIETTAQDYIKNHGAYFLILSLLRYYDFGHHDAYIFPEFRLDDKYRPDYLLIGKNSGGYEFVFVELEKPHGSVSISRDRYLGKVPRDGINQINDWKVWLEGHYHELESEFRKALGEKKELPKEFT